MASATHTKTNINSTSIGADLKSDTNSNNNELVTTTTATTIATSHDFKREDDQSSDAKSPQPKQQQIAKNPVTGKRNLGAKVSAMATIFQSMTPAVAAHNKRMSASNPSLLGSPRTRPPSNIQRPNFVGSQANSKINVANRSKPTTTTSVRQTPTSTPASTISASLSSSNQSLSTCVSASPRRLATGGVSSRGPRSPQTSGSRYTVEPLASNRSGCNIKQSVSSSSLSSSTSTSTSTSSVSACSSTTNSNTTVVTSSNVIASPSRVLRITSPARHQSAATNIAHQNNQSDQKKTRATGGVGGRLTPTRDVSGTRRRSPSIDRAVGGKESASSSPSKGLNRTASRVSRFNNAKAVFERLSSDSSTANRVSKSAKSSPTSTSTNQTSPRVVRSNPMQGGSASANSNSNSSNGSKDSNSKIGSSSIGTRGGSNATVPRPSPRLTTTSINKPAVTTSRSSVAAAPAVVPKPDSVRTIPSVEKDATVDMQQQHPSKCLLDKIVLEIAAAAGADDSQHQLELGLDDCMHDMSSSDTLDFERCFQDVEMMTEEEAQKLLSIKWSASGAPLIPSSKTDDIGKMTNTMTDDVDSSRVVQDNVDSLNEVTEKDNDKIEIITSIDKDNADDKTSSIIECGLMTEKQAVVCSADDVNNKACNAINDANNNMNRTDSIHDNANNGNRNNNDINRDSKITCDNQIEVVDAHNHDNYRRVEIDGVDYYVLPDGNYYIEAPGLAPSDDEDDEDYNKNAIKNQEFLNSRERRGVKFSHEPIRIFSTHAVEEYDRSNDQVNPAMASAEYELEKLLEKDEQVDDELSAENQPDTAPVGTIGTAINEASHELSSLQQTNGLSVDSGISYGIDYAAQQSDVPNDNQLLSAQTRNQLIEDEQSRRIQMLEQEAQLKLILEDNLRELQRQYYQLAKDLEESRTNGEAQANELRSQLDTMTVRCGEHEQQWHECQAKLDQFEKMDKSSSEASQLLERKYHRAKKIIKEMQQREASFTRREQIYQQKIEEIESELSTFVGCVRARLEEPDVPSGAINAIMKEFARKPEPNQQIRQRFLSILQQQPQHQQQSRQTSGQIEQALESSTKSTTVGPQAPKTPQIVSQVTRNSAQRPVSHSPAVHNSSLDPPISVTNNRNSIGHSYDSSARQRLMVSATGSQHQQQHQGSPPRSVDSYPSSGSLNSLSVTHSTLAPLPASTSTTSISTPLAPIDPTNQAPYQTDEWHEKPVYEWTTTQVSTWLLALGLDQYISKFEDRNVNGQSLIQLDSTVLKGLGVLNSNDRNLLKKKIREMRADLEREKKAQEKRQRESLKAEKLKQQAKEKLSSSTSSGSSSTVRIKTAFGGGSSGNSNNNSASAGSKDNTGTKHTWKRGLLS